MSSNKKVSIQQEKYVVDTYLANPTLSTVRNLAIEFRCHRGTITRVLRKHHITSENRRKIESEIVDAAIEQYQSSKIHISDLAKQLGIERHKLAYQFMKRGIKIHRTQYVVFSDEMKSHLSEVKKGIKQSKDHRYSQISVRNGINFDKEKYSDIEKMLFILRWTNYFSQAKLGPDFKMKLLEKFYDDEKFNLIYSKWIDSEKNKWYKPSPDHIIAKTNGGIDDLSNIQVLTWFENHTKYSMNQEEWNEFKEKTNTKSDLFM